MGNNAVAPRTQASEYIFDGKTYPTSSCGPYQKLQGTLGLTIDTSARTYDNLRGHATQEFKFKDRFNKQHVLKLQHGDSMTIFFPCCGNEVQFWAKGIDNPGDHLRTGCGASMRWCEAKFENQGDKVRGAFNFMADSQISANCIDWDNAERMLNTIEKGVDITAKCVDIGVKVAGAGA